MFLVLFLTERVPESIKQSCQAGELGAGSAAIARQGRLRRWPASSKQANEVLHRDVRLPQNGPQGAPVRFSMRGDNSLRKRIVPPHNDMVAVQASVLTIYTPLDGGSLHTNGHEMNLRANMAQKRSVLNATPANEIGMAGELRLGDWRWSEPPPCRFAPPRSTVFQTGLRLPPCHRLAHSPALPAGTPPHTLRTARVTAATPPTLTP